jgi:biopolymer transport protein ExbD/biopolymer transport protein TolR
MDDIGADTCLPCLPQAGGRQAWVHPYRESNKRNAMPQTAKQTGTSLSDINMVPFIDVVLVLLVIFMITAPILQSGIEVDLPKTKTVKDIPQERLVVTIDRAQRVYLGNESVNIHKIGERIKSRAKAPANDAVFVRCDETVPFGSFATVVDELRQSGIANISVVTQPISTRPSAP